MFNQEAFGALNSPFGERLIVFHGASRVGMAFESQMSIRLGLEVRFEVFRQRSQGLLLAGKETAVGIRDSWLIGCKVNTVQGKSGFEFYELR